MKSFPEIRLGEAHPHTRRVKARARKRQRQMSSRFEVLEARTLLAGGITGFNNGVGWTGNNNGTGGPGFTATTLTLTNGLAQSRSAFNNTLQPIGGPWTAAFTYQASPVGINALADGVTFMLQNQGPTALGSGGGGLGMAGITPSAEVELNVFSAHVIGTAFETDGANSQVYMSTGAVNLASGDPIGVVLTYNGTTLTETLTDLTTTATFSTSYTTNLQSVLGLSAGLVGFTGATGDGESVQTITNFSFTGTSTTLTGTSGNAITGVEGSSTGTVLLGTFVDADQASTVADYTTPPGSVVVNWGDGSAPQTLAAANLTPIGTPNGVVWTINAAHTYTEEGTYAYAVTVNATDGASTIVAGSATIADAALTPGAATHLTPNTGVALPSSTIVATFTDANTFATTADYTANIDWGDGSPQSTGTVVATATPGVFDIEGGHTYAKPGVDTTLVTVHDDGGSQAVVAGSSTVTDAAVTGSTASFTATEGKNTGLFVLATFTDPNTLATVADVNAALAVGGWGDRTPTAAGVTLVVQQIGVTPLTSATNPGAPIFEVLGSHTYAEETHAGLPDPLSVIITTLGGVATTLTSPPGGGVTVLDAPLTSSNGTTITGVEGISTGTVLLGTFTDANQGATIADFTTSPGSVVVNWGDGSAVQTLAAANLTLNGSPNGVVFTINASHDYVEEGTYAYTVTVTDAGGSKAVISGSATIADAPLTAAAVQPTVSSDEATTYPAPEFGGAPADNPGQLFSGPVAVFTDGNPLPPTGSSSIADFTATIDWGDGTPPTAGTIVSLVGGAATYEVTGSHTYATSGVNGGPGSYKIQVLVVDTGGSRLTIDNTATVTDNPIKVTGQLNPTSDSGLSTGTPDVTNVTQPDFFGTVLATLPSGATVPEPYAHVSLFATLSGGTPVLIGAVQAGSDGSWNFTSGTTLANGSYTITATAVDQFGETTTIAPSTITPSLLIDTTGPIITGAFFNRLNGQVDFTIQDPTPASGGPVSGVDVSTLLDSSNYLLTKVHANKAFPGKWIVTNVTETPGAAPNSFNVAVDFNSGKQIQGGFYLFTIRDSSNGNSSVQDNAENHLDGVFYGSFPSGNGINGSDFTAMLSGFHFKIFAPQTIIGTASAANGGVGGPPIGAVHSGVFSPVVPVGGAPVFGTDPTHLTGTHAATTKKAETRTKLVKPTAVAKSHTVKTAVHDDALKALVDQAKHGRLHN
jgi:large repetitive protein